MEPFRILRDVLQAMRSHYNTISLLVVAFVAGMMIPTVSRADVGPKPSATIDFEGLEKESYYVTLLSEAESSGPWVLESGYNKCDNEEEEKAQSAFRQYQDPDGFYFLGEFDDCSKTNQFYWGYWPPDRFKILLYFPEYQKLVACEGIYECYAFDSYYTVTMENMDLKDAREAVIQAEPDQSSNSATVVRSYRYAREVLFLILRIVATVILEVWTALFFFYWRKKQLLTITVTNVLTQGLLNASLCVIMYYTGLSFLYLFAYVAMEFCVFIIEGLVYRKYLVRTEGERYLFNAKVDQKYLPWIYAFVANAVSFVVGFVLSLMLQIGF